MKLTPASSVAKLYAQRLYRGLPCFDGDRDGVHAIGCFLVDESWRRRGVARALLRFAIDRARSSGARAIEAFPRRADGIPDEQLWSGPFELFVAEGFRQMHHQQSYPVLRLDLD
jgi:GNAT superfamily N-acetyltransferase